MYGGPPLGGVIFFWGTLEQSALFVLVLVLVPLSVLGPRLGLVLLLVSGLVPVLVPRPKALTWGHEKIHR